MEDAIFFAMPGYIRFYNRLPHALEFQFDSRSYQVPAHQWTAATYDLVQAAWKASRYKIKQDGSSLHGVVFEDDPVWGSPLTPDDLHEGDPLLGGEIDLELGPKVFNGKTYGPPEVVPVLQNSSTLPKPRPAGDSMVNVFVTGAGG